jgi:hypothetical protein
MLSYLDTTLVLTVCFFSYLSSCKLSRCRQAYRCERHDGDREKPEALEIDGRKATLKLATEDQREQNPSGKGSATSRKRVMPV